MRIAVKVVKVVKSFLIKSKNLPPKAVCFYKERKNETRNMILRMTEAHG